MGAISEVGLRGESPFRPGDVVALRSGSPDMTVAADADHDGEHLCVWFHAGQPWQMHYTPEALVLILRREGEPS